MQPPGIQAHLNINLPLHCPLLLLTYLTDFYFYYSPRTSDLSPFMSPLPRLMSDIFRTISTNTQALRDLVVGFAPREVENEKEEATQTSGGRKRRVSRCLAMCGNGVSPKSFQHSGPLKQHHALTNISWNLIYSPSLEAALANGTSFGAHAIVPARNKCGHLRQASSYPLDDVAVPEKSNSEHLMRATGSSLGGLASGPPFYTVASRGRRRLRRIVIEIHRACSLSVSLRQDRKVKGHLKSMTSPSSLVDVVRSKGQHLMVHLLDMGSLFSTSLSPHV
ncbi:hypothetical protein ALC53_00692 [Atta colombica]|uniref:Uncharacterized protein n=1 Tax=Atta colombica TaxID=520822 RepID=A0A195BWU2_9HYME|nr:hypothetical protein ALC53_00692 [Atta colombica]